MVECERTVTVARGDWRATIRTSSSMSATSAAFLVTNVLDAYEGDRRVFTKTGHADVPREDV
jgi:uncharacterized protein